MLIFTMTSYPEENEDELRFVTSQLIKKIVEMWFEMLMNITVPE